MKNFDFQCIPALWKAIGLLTLLMAFPLFLSGQVAINLDGSQPHASAMLEVKSTTKGMLIPRMNAQQRLAIPAPALGLMVYDTDSSALALFTASGWDILHPGLEPHRIVDNDRDTWVDTYADETAAPHRDRDMVVFNLGDTGFGGSGTIEMILRKNADGKARLEFPDSLQNTFIGVNAGENASTGGLNVALGYNALRNNTEGQSNTAIGNEALLSNQNGGGNTAVGFGTLQRNTTGIDNTAIGRIALAYNKGGFNNTAAGAEALRENTGGNNNTAIGAGSMTANTTGNSNTALGTQAMAANLIGFENTVVGFKALYNDDYGNFNTAVGFEAMLTAKGQAYANTALGHKALHDNVDGGYNTALGANALANNTTGTSNSALGYNANTTSGTLNNATALGSNAMVNASNKVVIGNNAPSMVIGGYAAWSNFSDGRFKQNVSENVPGLNFITRLRPVTYTLDNRKIDEHLTQLMPEDEKARFMQAPSEYARAQAIRHTGFIAQEVEQTAREIGYPFDGVNAPTGPTDNYSISYSQFVVPLVKAVQEQQAQIEQLKAENVRLQAQLQQLQTLEARIQALENQQR